MFLVWYNKNIGEKKWKKSFGLIFDENINIKKVFVMGKNVI